MNDLLIKEGQRAGLHGYPRPQLEREHWVSLDGEWDFALDPEARWTRPDEVVWRTRIRRSLLPRDARQRRR